MKRILSWLLMAMLVVTSLVGCGAKKDAASSGAKEGEKGKNIVRYNLGSDPQTLDPAKNAAVDGAITLVNMYEGLMRLDKNDKAIPGMAEKHEISPDGLTYTFHLRDAKWSDGQPVKAADFEFAWKRALDPATAAEYAYQMYYLKNGEKYNSGKAKVEDVGVKAIDDKTLQVTLESKVPYFLELTAFPTYFPLRKDIVDKDPEKWALKPETSAFNGPFKMVKWAHNDVVALAKNENYYDSKRVKLDGVEFTAMSEATTALTSFESGEIDGMDPIPPQQIPRLKEKFKEHYKEYPQLGSYYISFNVQKAPTDNEKVRRALSLAIDRRALTDIVCKGGEVPALAYVPPGIKDSTGKDFRDGGKDYGLKEKPQVEEAKKLLAEAGYPDGKGFPQVVYIYNSDERHKAVAEALQDMWKKNLGITTITLQNQEWKVFQETRRQGDYILARDGWLADYVDPMTFLDMFLSTSGNNHPHFKSPEFDKLIADSKSVADEKTRLDLMHKAEDMLLEKSVIAPLFYYTNPEVMRSNIKGVKVSPLGFVYFDEAHMEK